MAGYHKLRTALPRLHVAMCVAAALPQDCAHGSAALAAFGAFLRVIVWQAGNKKGCLAASFLCASRWTRTIDPLINSQML